MSAGSLSLFEAMLAAGVRDIVFSSTCATYGLPETVPIPETAPQRPVNPYGESKLMIERVLYWLGAAHGMRHALLRYFNAAGADPEGEIGEDHEPETHLIPLILDAALGRRPAIDIYGTDYPTPDGTAIRDYIHVQDLAEAHVRAIDHSARRRRSLALNLGTGRGHSVREVIAAAERVTGRSIARRETRAAARRSARSGRRCRARARSSGLDAAALGPRHHHRDGLGLAPSPTQRGRRGGAP